MIIYTLVAKCNCDETIELVSKYTKREILEEKTKFLKSNSYSSKQLKIRLTNIKDTIKYSYKIMCMFNNTKVSEITISHDFKKCLEGYDTTEDYFIIRKSKNNISFYLNAINEVCCLTKVMNYIHNTKEYEFNRKRFNKI